MIATFDLDATGWHEGTQRHYPGRLGELVKADTPEGDRYRRMFLGLPQEEVKPFLRSLPIAKECSHNLGVIGTAKAGCGECTTYGCGVKGSVRLSECVYCASYLGKAHEDPAPNTGISWTPIRFDETTLAPGTGGQRLNGSILPTPDGYLFAYRQDWGYANIRVVRLNRGFDPVGDPVQLDLDYPAATEIGKEDPRLFWHKGKPHVWYIGWNGNRSKHWHKANVLFARLNPETLAVEDKFFPQIPGRTSWEKNHAYFDHNGELHCVYDTSPTHKVFRVECNQVLETYETPTAVNWRYGFIRGGASPVLHDGEYYHFFHGMIERGEEKRRLYTVGVACFEAKPPFRVTRITHEPLEIAPDNPGGSIEVLFPGGAAFVDGRWVVSCGMHDTHTEVRFYSERMVEDSLASI